MNPESLLTNGRPLVAAIVALILLVPAVAVSAWTLRTRHDPRTNRKCAVSVVFGLGVILILAGVGVASALFEAPAAVRTFGSLAAFLTLIVAVILAIGGLKEMNDRFGRLHYDHGKKRAITVLTLPVLFAASIVTSVMIHSSGTPLFSGEIGATAGATITSKQWNFQIIAPPPWVVTDAARLHPQACAGLARRGPAMSAVVLAEDVSKSGSPPLASSVAAVTARLKESGHEILAEVEQSEGGLAARRVESASTRGSARLFHVHWLASYGDIFYQLIVWGPHDARDAVRTEARKISAGFRIVDPNLNPLPSGDRAPATFTSERFGYSIDLANTVWNRRWPGLEKEVPFAEFGVLNARGTAAFCVVPVWIGPEDPGFEPIATALATRFGIPFPDPALFGMRNVRQGGVRGRAFAYERTQGELNLLYRIRIVRGRGYAYILAAWMNKKAEAASEFLDLAMDCVAFPDTAEPSPLLTGDRIRATHSAVWNDIGISLVRGGTPLLAIPWFGRAYEINRANLVPLANQADGLVKTGRSAEALNLLERETRNDTRPGLLRLYAQVLQANGRLEDSIRVLLEARQAAPTEGDTLLLLIDAYLAAKKFPDAVRETDVLIGAVGETPGLLQRKVVGLAQLKRYGEARETLGRALAKEPNNRDLLGLQQQLDAVTQAAKK